MFVKVLPSIVLYFHIILPVITIYYSYVFTILFCTSLFVELQGSSKYALEKKD